MSCQAAELHVSSAATGEVLVYDVDTGMLKDALVSQGSGGFSGPFGISFGAADNLYVDSTGSGEVLRYNGAIGSFTDVFASVSSPITLAIRFDDLVDLTSMVFGPDGALHVGAFSSGLTDHVLIYNGTTSEFIDVFIHEN